MTQQISYNEEMVGASHPTKADTLNRFINLITAAGDLLYGTAAATAIALAKGAANTKLFMNAGATAPEWAVGLKMGLFTRDMTAATGNVSYTGVGFKPAGLFFFGGISATLTHTIGAHFLTFTGSLAYYANNTVNLDNNYGIALHVDGVNHQKAGISTLDSDGFTLTWTKTASPTGTATIYYLVFR